MGDSLPPEKKTPASSPIINARPMPRGAMNVALCFSTARRKMVKIRPAVRNISMTVHSVSSWRPSSTPLPLSAMLGATHTVP